MEHPNRGNPAVATRENASGQIIHQLDQLIEMAEALANKADNRLAPITRPSPPAHLEGGKPIESMPSYFEEIRSKIFTVNRHLANIDDTLDRLEI